MLMVKPASSKLFLFHLYACCCFLLSYHVVAGAAASPFSFSFDFSNKSSYHLDDLLFQGNASLDGMLVDLTSNSLVQRIDGCTGRMSYNHPVPFYDATTGVVASFSTRFHFAIRVVNASGAGDGMAFFLSSYPSVLPGSGGGNLALHNGDGMDAVGTKRIIAVEFDTFQNDFDPPNSTSHIGIDINTVRASVNTTSLNGSMDGAMTAFITFNSSTRMLVASLQFDDSPSRSYEVSTQLPHPVTDLLPSEVAVGFSAATGALVELHQIMSWSFNSTLVRKDNRKLVIRGAVLCTVLLTGSFLVWFILSWLRWRRIRDSFSSGTTGLRRFKYSDLSGATGRFSKDSELGEGAFGSVYKGSYTDHTGKQEVAVKKIKKTTGEAGGFISELRTVSGTRHMNLVELKGWCCSRNIYSMTDFMCWCWQPRVELYLVYELVPNGTLADHLHGENLAWEKRYQIVKGIGSALRYLHHECRDTILHRDIKPSNILLDYNFNAKLADFGLSRIATQDDSKVLTRAIGTEGYIDPQCRKHGKVEFGRKSDVYSFGIVLLEIACTGKSREQVNELYRRSAAGPEVMKAAADQTLGGAFDETQMERVIFLGLKCSDLDGKQRPYIEDAMKFLEDGIELPAVTEMEGQQGARFLGIVSSDEHAFLPTRLRS